MTGSGPDLSHMASPAAARVHERRNAQVHAASPNRSVAHGHGDIRLDAGIGERLRFEVKFAGHGNAHSDIIAWPRRP
jgi:hypothetical protein